MLFDRLGFTRISARIYFNLKKNKQSLQLLVLLIRIFLPGNIFNRRR